MLHYYGFSRSIFIIVSFENCCADLMFCWNYDIFDQFNASLLNKSINIVAQNVCEAAYVLYIFKTNNNNSNLQNISDNEAHQIIELNIIPAGFAMTAPNKLLKKPQYYCRFVLQLQTCNIIPCLQVNSDLLWTRLWTTVCQAILLPMVMEWGRFFTFSGKLWQEAVQSMKCVCEALYMEHRLYNIYTEPALSYALSLEQSKGNALVSELTCYSLTKRGFCLAVNLPKAWPRHDTQWKISILRIKLA